jgi:hypothetical protein
MSQHSISYAAPEHLKDLDVLEVHLTSDPVTAELATPVVRVRGDLKTCHEDREAKGLQVSRASDVVLRTDEDLDNAVRIAYDVALADVAHNRRDPKVVMMFPRGTTGITRLPYLEEVMAVHVLAGQFAEDPSPKLQEQAAILNAAADRLVAVHTDRMNAMIAESSAFARLQISKANAIDTIDRVRRELQILFPHDRARVRTYFREVNHPKKDAGDSPSEPAAPPTA